MPKKDSTWIENSGLYGTWTFTTQTMTDAGYYKGIAYVVMHLMPDPMQVKSCVLNKNKNNNKTCIEADNRACSHAGAVDNENEVCVDTETTKIEWSDVTAFFQFGFRLRTGIVRKSYHEIHTSDWLGPYNMILAPIEGRHHNGTTATEPAIESGNHSKPHDEKDLFVSRYVNTPWTEIQLQRPFASSAIFNFDSDVLEDVVGTRAINTTIHTQKKWNGKSTTTYTTEPKNLESAVNAASFMVESIREGWNEGATTTAGGSDPAFSSDGDDPYAMYSKTCDHGDLRPILPRLEVVRTTHPSNHTDYENDVAGGGKPPKTTFSMRLDYSMLSLPEKGTDGLYKLWPSMKSHLGSKFPLRGPYCYGKDPNRAWAIHLSYDSSSKPEASTWKGVKGCVPPWPCWKDPPPPTPSSAIPEDNHSGGSYVLDPKGVELLIVYAVGFLLVVSLIFNCKLANKLKRAQESRSSGGLRGTIQEQRLPQHRPPPDAFSPTSGTRSNSPSDYLLEAAGSHGANNSIEEPLLTAPDNDMDSSGVTPVSSEGVEESKQEVE